MANRFLLQLRHSNSGWNWADVYVEDSDNSDLWQELRSQGNFGVASFGPSFDENEVKTSALKWIEENQTKLDAFDYKFRKYHTLKWSEKYGDVEAHWTNKLTGREESDLFLLNLHKNFENAEFVKWMMEKANFQLER